MPHSERVTGPHAFYLQLEGAGLPMHMGALATFDSGPLTHADGVLDIDTLEHMLEWMLSAIPHARQRLRQVPFEQHPVWIDDDRFSLHYHMRHTRLPHPGTDRQLKRLVGRLMSEPLDRHKPLWEVWVIEGVEAGQLAFMVKLHPSVLEGARFDDLFARFRELSGPKEVPQVPPWRPRPAPAPAQLLADSASYWSREAWDALERTRQMASDPASTWREAARATGAVRGVLGEAVRGQERTTLNPPRIGSHRRVDLLDLPRCEVETVTKALSCTLVDIALSVLACGLGRFFHQRGNKFEGDVVRVLLTLPSDPSVVHEGPLTIRIALPFAQMDPVRRVAETMRLRNEALHSGQVTGFDLLEKLEAWTPARVQKLVSQTTGRHGTANILMHVFEGAGENLRLLGAPMRRAATFTPLFIDQALSVALTTCADQVSIGLNADWDRLQDLHELVEAIQKSFKELQLAVLAHTAAPPASGDERSSR